jgi:hypothetical protein
VTLRKSSILLVALSSAVLLLPAASQAATPAPGWTIDGYAAPTDFTTADNPKCLLTAGKSQQPFCDAYRITATNAGSLAASGSAVTLEDELPAGLTVQQVAFFWPALSKAIGAGGGNIFPNLEGFGFCSKAELRCSVPFPVAPDESVEMIVYVSVDEPAQEGEALLNTATVSGAAAAAKAETHNRISPATPPFGFSDFSNYLAGLSGSPETGAGAHPYELITTIGANSQLGGTFGSNVTANTVEDVRDILVDLPPGLAGSALSTPETCTQAQLAAASGTGGCPPATVVGHIDTRRHIESTNASVDSPLWNITPEQGVAAEFGYIDSLNASHVLYASIAPSGEGYVLRTTSPEIPQVDLSQITVNVFGDPVARGREAEEKGGAQKAGDVPTFSAPASCDGQPLISHIHMDSWQDPGPYNPDGSPDFSDPRWAAATSTAAPASGCGKLVGLFKPSLEATPETNRADSPTGIEVTLKVAQKEDVTTLGVPPLRKALVALPAGMTVNPSSANGLEGCSLAALGMSASGQPDAAPPHCPDASKIGHVELETPALKGTLEGTIYVAKQTENPFGSLLALYIVIDDPTTGVIVKIPAEIKADPDTGQLTTIVDNSPQFPFSVLRAKFYGGQKAALRTPATCGTYKVTSSLTPWSAPESGPPATPSDSFEITQSPSGGPCPKAAADQPHSPSFSAGTISPLAGAYSPFVLKLRREDGSQELSGLSLALPPGLVGKLAGLSECSEAQLAAAKAREALGQGALEQSSPSCPASSEVGTVTAGAGAGLTPYYATGHAYLAGPYKGAPLSLVVITPAVAGPFDLGSVVIRNALYVNPETTQISAVADVIPHILDGIPLDIRSIVLNMSRNQFTLNPTSCERKAITGAATSVLGVQAPLTNPFQVGGCNGLGFKPKLSLKLKGATRRTSHPRLIATLKAKPGEANIAHAQVKLPKAAFLDQGHIGTICTRPDFAAQSCPPASVYGTAQAKTPLLDQPLSGKVYLRSNPAHKLPDLVVDLGGQIEVALAGKTDSVKGALRNTFETVPDAPVSSFRLELYGGKRGLIELSSGFCKAPNATVKLLGQNGKSYDTIPVVGSSCPKGRKHGGGGHHKHRGAP